MEESKYKVEKIKSKDYEVKQFCFVIPIYNLEKWLPMCLESVENQTNDNYNVVLIDDGSTDSCPQICDDFVATHKNAIVVHKQNGGLLMRVIVVFVLQRVNIYAQLMATIVFLSITLKPLIELLIATKKMLIEI